MLDDIPIVDDILIVDVILLSELGAGSASFDVDISIVDVMLDDIPIVDVGLIVDVIRLSELGAGSGSFDVDIIAGAGSASVVLFAATKTAECTAKRHQTGMGVMMRRHFLCEQK
jgi:hypothetical protein